MKTLKMTVELTYDDTIFHEEDPESIEWFFKDILARSRLILHSNEIGDEIGDVKVLDILSKDD